MDNNNPIKYSDLISPDNSIEVLIKQLNELAATYKDLVKTIKSEAIQISESLKGSKGAPSADATRQIQQTDKLARAYQELSFAESENAKRLAEVNAKRQEATRIVKLEEKFYRSAIGSYDRLSAQYSLNKIRLNAMSKAMRENTEAGKALEKQTREIYEEMKRLQEATGKHQLNVGNYPELTAAVAGYGESITGALGLNDQFGQSLLALGQQGGGAIGIIGGMRAGITALGQTLMGLMANPVFLAIAGVAGVAASFKWWYDYNVGLQEATRLTQQFTGKSGDDLKAYRNQVQAVADTFNVDFKETLISVNAVSKQFGISAAEALQIVQSGFVAGADANGEFLDTLKEYPAYFREAGLGADEFVAIVAQSTKMGIFSDKGVDTIKEANLRLREMTTSTAEALEGIGISSAQVQADLQSGSKTTFDVIQEVSAKLNELPESSAQVGAAIADIFGGPGEDAGLQYLRTLKDISLNLDEVKEQAGILGTLQEEQLQSQLDLQNALSGLFDATGGNFETLTTRAKVFVNQGLTAIIRGVISLINYFIDFYNQSIVFRALWNGIIVNFKNAFDTIGNLFNALVDSVKALGRVLKGAFTLNFEEMKRGLADYAQSYANLVKQTVKDVQQNVEEARENAQKKVKPIVIPVTTSDGDNADTATPIGATNAGGAKNITTDAKKKTDKQVNEEEQKYQRILKARRAFEDKELELEEDAWVKKRRQTQYRYQREIEDLEHTLAIQTDLTEDEREYLLGRISLLQTQYSREIESLNDQLSVTELEQQQKGIDLRLRAVEEGSEAEYKLLVERNRVALQLALAQNALLAEAERQSVEDIKAIYDKELADIIAKFASVAQKNIESAFNTAKDAVSQFSKSAGETFEMLRKLFTTEWKDGESLASILGIDEKALNSMLIVGGSVISMLQEITAERIKAADVAVQSAERETDAARDALQAELTARNEGYAHNVAQARKDLELARRTEKQALAERQRAQRQQEAIDTATQAINLATAGALIWKQLGFPWAIPAIGAMFASFAATKIMAARASRETYGDGTVELLHGGSHQSGNDIDLGTKPDGTRRRAEGGEYFAVFNKRASRNRGALITDVVKSLNNGTFAQKYQRAYDMGGGIMLNVGGSSPDLRRLSDDVRKIKEQNERRTYLDGEGNVVEVYKNVKRVIKKC